MEHFGRGNTGPFALVGLYSGVESRTWSDGLREGPLECGKVQMGNALIEKRRAELTALCQRYRVLRLELFGSAVDDRFDAETSDLDFLVEFFPLQPGKHADAYFGLLEALQDLFQRPIDLVETRAIRNPYFLRSVNRNRTVLYAA